MATYKTPGVYIEEVPRFPLAIVAANIGLPVFIGYTEKSGGSSEYAPHNIHSLAEFEAVYGRPQTAVLTATVAPEGTIDGTARLVPALFNLHHALRMFFDNAGGNCTVISAGDFETGSRATVSERYLHHQNALEAAAHVSDITLLVFPDAASLVEVQDNSATSLESSTHYYHKIYRDALAQAARLKYRFVIADVFEDPNMDFSACVANFREGIGDDNLRFGATYTPYLKTNYPHYIDENDPAALVITGLETADGICLHKPGSQPGDPLSLFDSKPELYNSLVEVVAGSRVVLPPSGAIAGIYWRNDETRGIWKAPANISIAAVSEVTVNISDALQDGMNVIGSGKSINAIRHFTNKGIIVGGGRTLAGNDNEFRYISAKRFLMMCERAVEAGLASFVFEPNDANSWMRMDGLVQAFLNTQWRLGAIVGAKPSEAYYVRVGLNSTMTAVDLLEGRIIIEIGLAVVRPAEFIILRVVVITEPNQ